MPSVKHPAFGSCFASKTGRRTPRNRQRSLVLDAGRLNSKVEREVVFAEPHLFSRDSEEVSSRYRSDRAVNVAETSAMSPGAVWDAFQ